MVFGPTKGETTLSANGKRLRVEQGNLGQAGGFVVTERSEVRENGTLAQNSG